MDWKLLVPNVAAAMKLNIIFLVAICTVSLAKAQPQSPFLAPPPLVFDQARKVYENDFIERYNLQFPSAVPSPYPVNDTVPIIYSLPKNRIGTIPLVVILHYYGASDRKLEDALVEALNLRGIATIQTALPYHLSRTPEGTISGELAILPDPDALKSTMIQAISDIRRIVDWTETRDEIDHSKIGITGMSLGAVVSSLAYGVDARFQAQALLLGGADLAHIIWHSSRVVSQRNTLRSMGYTEDSLRTALAPIEPLNYLSPGDQRPSYIVRARYDTVIPAESTKRLKDRLPHAKELVLETGHYGGALVERRLMRSVASFFEQSFSGREFVAPQTFYSPTIRAGILLDPESGIQLGLGIDFWRSDLNGRYFASAYLTPNGPRGFLGAKLNRDVSIGVMVMPKKTTWGLMWSTVF